jgi:hypothetical protein
MQQFRDAARELIIAADQQNFPRTVERVIFHAVSRRLKIQCSHVPASVLRAILHFNFSSSGGPVMMFP